MSDIKAFLAAEWQATQAAWPRWAAAFRQQTHAATDLVLELAAIEPGMHVLDLASGVGEPALELAPRVGAHGQVIASDLVSGPLRLCEAEAQRRVLPQLRTIHADIDALPFAAARFDAVTCRLGIMFCADSEHALKEVRRVLRPGGSASFVVWGDPAQPLFDATLGELQRDSSFRAPASNQPGPFRYATLGLLGTALEQAGFRDVRSVERSVPWPWPGAATEMWAAWLDLAGPSFRAAVDAVASECPDPHARVSARLRRYQRQDCTDPNAWLIGVTGRA
jgi:SAM-dependent methyltransferase